MRELTKKQYDILYFGRFLDSEEAWERKRLEEIRRVAKREERERQRKTKEKFLTGLEDLFKTNL